MPVIELDAKDPIILSVGGSLIVPNGGPDARFLKKLHHLITLLLKKNRRFILVAGGGKTARHYIDAAKKISGIDAEDLDWLGIHATRLNAHLLRTVFRGAAHPVVVKNPTQVPDSWKEPILVAAGWKPGWSTDYVATRLAETVGAKTIINLSNIEYVYSADPRLDKNAEPLKELSWSAYRNMVGDIWDPGLSAPFDPVASKFCDEHKMHVAILHGKKMRNLRRALTGKSFTGTLIT
ncbi:MAG: UMP kinase [Patescibacteria group bacterium]|jgi:uridylate kinase